MKTKTYYVYMVRCRYGSLYAGYTIDLARRLKEHQEGRGAKYLKGRSPMELVYVKHYKTLSAALKAEAAIKAMPKSEKEEMLLELKEIS